MAKKSSNDDLDLKSLQARLDWLEEERLRTSSRVKELEQRLAGQEQHLVGANSRLKEMGETVSRLSARKRKVPVEETLDIFRTEMMEHIEESTGRLSDAITEAEKLRRLEHESVNKELGRIAKEITRIAPLSRELEQRQAEEARLGSLISGQQSRLLSLQKQVESAERSGAVLNEQFTRANQGLGDVQTSVADVARRLRSHVDQLESTAGQLVKIDSRTQQIAADHEELSEKLGQQTEQQQVRDHERQRRMDAWQHVLDEHESTLEKYAEEWQKVRAQNKEAKATLQTLLDWQQQAEKSALETSERLRVETERLGARIERFRQDVEARLKNYEFDMEQRLATVSRREQELREELQEHAEQLTRLAQAHDENVRVQEAQARALKKLPVTWLEEVEKARAADPNRRRQPDLVTVPEE